MKKKKRPSSLYIFPILFFIIIGFYVFRYFFFNIDTEIIKYGEMEDYFEAKAIVVKNESVYNFPSEVEIINKAQEGERVPFGEKLADIVKGEEVKDDIQDRIIELNERIEQIESSTEKDFFESDAERLTKTIDDKVQYIKILSREGDFEELSEVKSQLASDLQKKSSISGKDSFYGRNLEQLKKERSQLEEMYTNSLETITAATTGIVSFKLDGYEQSLNPGNIEKITVDELKNLIGSLDRVEDNENKPSGVKIIDNFSWYLCMVIDEKSLNGLEVGQKVKISLKEYDNEYVTAKIHYMSEPINGELLVSYEITDNIDNYYDKRKVDVKVVTKQYEGFLVSEECIVEIENQKGLYVVREGIVKFVAIDVIATNKGNALIKNIENKEDVIKLSSGNIKVYDEVVKNTDKVKPNQRIL